MANEQEAAAGLYSLLKANPGDGTQMRPDPPRSVSLPQPKVEEPEPSDDFADVDNSAESMRKLTEMLLQNRPVVDPLKNQGFGIVTPHQHDILSGRGNGANQHPGNIFFRNLIHKYKHHYIHTGPSEKKLITKRIVEEVQLRDPPGRFLKQNHETELWDCLDIDKVLKKTGQALREKAPELKKRAREEYKVRVTTSQESYFQNSRPLMTMQRDTGNHNDYESMSMRFDNDVPVSSAKHSMSFPMQAGALDALAYQTIPLAGPPKGANDSFNMAHLAAITNHVDPTIRKKTEQLIAKAVDPNISLADLYDFIVHNPSAVNINKLPKVVRSRYPLPIRRSTFKVNRIKGEEVVPNAASPHPHDVLFRDSSVVATHPGSKFFCEQVNILLPQYKGPIVNEKRIEQKIIAAIGARWPPGRFLCAADGTCTSWHVLSFDQALQATSAHLRRACFEAQRIVIPNQSDVLVIRGNSQHQGNVHFRNLIEKYYSKYEHVVSPNIRKSVAKQIVGEVVRVGGRFLKFNPNQNFWEPLEYETVMTKTLQGMRDYQKKKEQQLKPVKTIGVIVPSLNCVKESVEDKGKNSDPPGVFYNYYSKTGNNDDNTLAIDFKGNDPPGQVANVVPTEKNDTQSIKKPDSPRQNPRSSQYRVVSDGALGNLPEMRVPGGMGPPPPPPMGFFTGTTTAPTTTTAHVVSDPPINESRKRELENVGDLRPTEKRMKLEP